MSGRYWITPTEDIPWSKLTPASAREDIPYAIELAKTNIDKICNLKDEEMNYDSVFHAYEYGGDELHFGYILLSNMEACCNTPEIREVSNELTPKIVDFYASVPLNLKLWNVIKKTAAKLENENLSSEKKRFIEDVILTFKMTGADLPDDKRERFAQIQTELELKTKKFKENVLDSTNAWELYIDDPKKLEGLPESLLSSAAHDAEEKGKKGQWRFNLQFPSRYPIMKYAANEELRKTVWIATNEIGNKGEHDNTEVIKEILMLRQEQCDLLGYKDFADFTTFKRMAKTGATALKFVEDLHDVVEPQFIEEEKQLKAFISKKKNQIIDDIYPWENQYWSEVQRKELYDFDSELMRPYFAVDEVLKGLFKIVSTIYGFSVTEKKTYFIGKDSTETPPEDAVEVWHPEVRYFEVHDNTTKKHIGSFYTDWYPRETKRAGAWMSDILIESRITGKPQIGLICGNIQKPIGDKPALIDHYEVETIFHEFGHLTHLLLTDVEIKSLGGTNVAWDFVELPSQFLECWTWERSALDLFAKHYQTGEKIPDELFNKMIRARNYQSAEDFMGQLFYGKVDLEYHLRFPKLSEEEKQRPLLELEEEWTKGYRHPCPVPRPPRGHSLTHLFGSPIGYGAGYYSYKWAEVLAADCFTKFQETGVMNQQTGLEFRNKILSKGNTAPADQLFRDFMGREPCPEALLKQLEIHH